MAHSVEKTKQAWGVVVVVERRRACGGGGGDVGMDGWFTFKLVL